MKKLFVMLLSSVILASSVSVNSYSYAASAESSVKTATITKGEPNGSVSAAEPSDKDLEEVILSVKKVITIPKEFTEFNYYFNNSNPDSTSYWFLTWTDPKSYSDINVNCDAKKRITYYYKYNNSDKSVGIAKYLKNELKSKADDFIKKIAPEVSNYLSYKDTTYDGIYDGNYVYNYQRENNGVVFPDNAVSVSVNSVTGEVSGASVKWLYDTTVPDAKTKLTKDEAAKLIKAKMKMKLIYRSSYYSIYDKKGIKPKKAILVYEPSEDYISVDAKTGEVYLTRSEWVDVRATKGASSKEAADEATAGGAKTTSLTPEELTKVEELKNLISKSKAIEIITSNPYLYLDKNMQSYSATLSKRDSGNGDTSYIWNISMNDPREIDYETEKDYFRAYADATVDAESGKILSFNTSLKSNYDETAQKWKTVKITYDKVKGQEILEKFLKSQIKDRFSNSVLSEQNDGYIAYYKDKTPVYGGYNYRYNRVNEGVEYPDNNIYGAVDGVSGKIYNYSFNWDKNITFEPTKGAMSAEEAMNYYLNNEGYGLKYEINVINKYDSAYGKDKELYDYTKAYSVDNEIRLVYRPDVNPSYISPFTGAQLNYNGEVYKVTKPYAYKDVENTDSNRNILLLSDMNIGFEGEYFLPNNNITIGEINFLLEKTGYGYSSSKEENSNTSDLITREELANTFIVRLGLEKLSKLPNIYTTGYSDESNINKEYVGAVALAKALNIMPVDAGNSFSPTKNVTRLEAVNFILNYIDVKQKGLY